MGTLAYPASTHAFHDGGLARSISRTRSRRQSFSGLGYSGQQQIGIQFPHSDYGGMYDEPPMSGGLYGEYPKPSYSIYASSNSDRRRSQHMQAFDDIAVRDSYFPDERQRRLSPGAHNAIVPRSAMIPSAMMSNHRPRRRSSSVSFDMRATAPPMDTFRRLSGAAIKLKIKGASRSGLSLGDAQNNVRLSGNNSYTFADFNCNVHGRITLKIRWQGYSSLSYDIPLDGYGEQVNLQSLARRTARAVVHFLQTNIIPIPWDCVEMLRLEEVSRGIWQPVLAVR